ncbi:MAG: LPS export ABC transporter periplasmic protein LptC [Hyphomicrobiales bacterium]
MLESGATVRTRRSRRGSGPSRAWIAPLVVAVLAALVPGCRNRPASSPTGEEVRLPDQEARDFSLTESSEGRKNWTLWASYAAMYNSQNLVDARTVRIEFFNQKGERFSTLTADEGQVHQQTNDLEARGHVRVTTETGITMETDSLRWQNAAGKIVSEGFVKVTRQHDVVTGYGFVSDPSLDHFHLTREVKAEVRDTDVSDGGRAP